jgi:alpha-glucosidase
MKPRHRTPCDLARTWWRAARELWLMGCLCLAVASAAAAPVALGPAVSAAKFGHGAQITLGGAGGSLRVEFLAHGLLLLDATPPGVAPLSTGAVLPVAAAAGSAEVFEDSQSFVIRQAGLVVLVLKNPLQVVVVRDDGSVLLATLPGGLLHDAAAGTVVQLQHARPGERFFGMGMAGGPLDRRGRVLTMRNTDNAAYSELTNPLYSSTPFWYSWLSGRTHGQYFDNPSIATFDFDSGNAQVLKLAAVGGTLKNYLLAGPQPLDVAKAFSALTGATPRPPQWATGYMQAHFGYASAAEVQGLAAEFRRLRIPCDAFFLDLDYTDRLFTLSWNPQTWPNPPLFNAQMNAQGFRVVNILEPLVTVFDPLWPYLAGSGYLVKGPTGDPLVTNIWMGDVSFIDFSKPSARDFFKSALKLFLASGTSGLWADLNEPAANDMPYAVFDFEGKPRYEFASRNVYALWENATLRDALLEARPNERSFIVSRSGFAGVQRYAANWSGDTDSSFDSLRVQVQIANAMGLSGQNFFGADIGGFLGAPNAELFIRWLQFGTATPLARNHSMNTSPLREPWRYGEPYTSVARAQIEWRYRLMPYLGSLFAQAEDAAEPVLAPPWFHFHSDTGTHNRNGEFMLGPAMLVAPVVTEGATSRTVYLPAGSAWIDYHTGVRFNGGQSVTVPAPLERLPLFARAGAIIPMGPVRQYAGEPVSDELVLDIFAGADGRFVLHEDDGISLDYQRGAFRSQPLQWLETSTTAQLSLGTAAGNRTPVARPWWLQVRQWPTAPSAVRANGSLLPRAVSTAAIASSGGWAHDAPSGRLFIRLPGQGPAAVLITR